jgi:hypothetical protein
MTDDMSLPLLGVCSISGFGVHAAIDTFCLALNRGLLFCPKKFQVFQETNLKHILAYYTYEKVSRCLALNKSIVNNLI